MMFSLLATRAYNSNILWMKEVYSEVYVLNYGTPAQELQICLYIAVVNNLLLARCVK